MAIKVWDYLKEYEQEKEEVHSAIKKVLQSGWLILGSSVEKFESKFSDYCDVKYGVGVNSGTDALFLALKAIGIGKGDEVITVSNTAVPTVSAIISTGAIAKFVDINTDTYLMDTNLLEREISPKTKCILPVHLYGQCVKMDVVQDIASSYGLKVIEDCAQAHGAEFKGEKAGSMSDMAAFSFYPTKILGGFGDGGMIITSDEKLRDKLRRLRFYGMEQSYYSIEHGYNTRLDELHAEILTKKLTHLDKYVSCRRRLAMEYEKLLDGTKLQLPITQLDCYHAYYLYVCRHQQRDQIIAKLREKEIFLNISYPWPIHTMSGFKSLGYKEGDLPNTEAMAKEIFSLPLYPSLTEQEQMIVVKELSEVLQ